MNGILHSGSTHRRTACIIFTLQLCLALWSGAAPAAPRRYSFAGLTNKQGLSNNSISCLLQDQKGLIWIGTQGGLNCYDGYDFQVFHRDPADPNSLSSESIYSLFQDSRGRLFVGTSTHVELWDGRRKVRDLVNDGATSICQDRRGGVWFGCWGSVRYLAPGSDSLVQITPALNDSPKVAFAKTMSILCDRQERIWLGLARQGLYRFHPTTGRTERIVLPSHLPEGATDHIYHAMVEDPAGRIWIASLQGLYCLDQRGWTHFQHDPGDPASLANDNILSLALSDSTTLWIGTDGSGLDCLDLQTMRFSHYPPFGERRVQTVGDKITAILADASGLLWAGTQGNGLFKGAAGRLQLTHSTELLPQADDWVRAPVWFFLEDSTGTTWIGSQQGLYSVDAAFRSVTPHPGPTRLLGGLPIRGIWIENERTIWLGSQGKGLWRWRCDTGEMTHFVHQDRQNHSLNSQVIYDLQPDGHGSLWLACNTGGLYRFDLHSSKLEHVPLPNHPPQEGCWVTDLCRKGPDELWFTSWNNGLYCMSLHDRRIKKISLGLSLEVEMQFPLLTLHFTDPRTLWVGTYGDGLYRMDLTDSTIHHITIPARESDNIIYAIQQDPYGHLWCSGNQGLFSIAATDSRFVTYDRANGIEEEEFNLGASLLTRHGNLLFGGMNGFYLVQPQQTLNRVAPRLLITSVRDARKQIDYYLPPGEVPPLTFGEDDNPFRITLLGLHYLDPLRNQYAYQLQGLDKRWMEMGTGREIILNHLPPGHYTLMVKAANGDGLWSEPAGFRLQITVPFLKSRWFFGLLAVLAAGAAAVFYRARLYQVRLIERARMQEREAVRSRIGQDFHDELGHRLSKILLFSRMALAEKKRLSPSGQAALDKIIADSTELNKEMRQFLWELDPAKDSLQHLLVELKRFSDDLFEHTEIAFQLQGVGPDLEKIILPPDWRSHVLRIFKEGMVNIFKHSRECNQVILRVTLLLRHIGLELIDNGNGFDPQTAAAGEGLKNMRRRAAAIGASLTITSRDGETVISLTLPQPGL